MKELKDAIISEMGLGRKDGGEEKGINPASIVKAVVKTAQSASRFWGHDKKRDVPNYYIARINYADWEDYYQTDRKEIERKLSLDVKIAFDKKQYATLGKPLVKIAVDHSLAPGALEIDASFSEPTKAFEARSWSGDRDPFEDYFAREARRPFCDKELSSEGGRSEECGRDEGDEASGIRVPDSIHSVSEHKAKNRTPQYTLPNSSENKTWVMPREGKVSYLISSGGERIAVHAGDSVGVLRRDDEDAPQVMLDIGSFPFVSQIHGVFGFSGEWFFENKGSNGTVIYGSGEGMELKEGDKARIADGSVIVFAHGDPLEFRER